MRRFATASVLMLSLAFVYGCGGETPGPGGAASGGGAASAGGATGAGASGSGTSADGGSAAGSTEAGAGASASTGEAAGAGGASPAGLEQGASEAAAAAPEEGAEGAPANESAAVPPGPKPKVAYVTNGVASFWTIAEAGAMAAGRDFQADVDVRMPPGGLAAEQKSMLEDLITVGVDGIAVSPIDPVNQTDILNTVAENTRLITHDSDAPSANRLLFIGVSNYEAGWMCGELVKEAMPEGGSLMIFVGRLSQDNARLRRQGLIDCLLDRTPDPERAMEPADAALVEGKYKILGTRTDDFNFTAAKSLGEDALAAHPDLNCMVGLFAYNPPYLIEALRSADKLGKVKLVGFDEDDKTLQAIKDGHCYGTVVQDPYRYGYESVRVLAALTRGDKSVIPESKILNVPARKIRAAEVDAFWTELKRLTGKTE